MDGLGYSKEEQLRGWRKRSDRLDEDVERAPNSTLRRGKGLDKVGRRGKRNAAADKASADVCHGLPCICGCRLPPMWAHIDGRSDEVRHDPVFSVPACEYLHPWMDQGRGVECKREMCEVAKAKGERLEHDDVYDLLVENGYYTDLAKRRAAER